MEYIYFAVSNSHPGMVKIGRTDRPVSERMSELSSEDYGLSDFEGDSKWNAVEVIKVEDNVEAERLLHDHFDSVRVENGREIFYSDDISAMATEGAELVDGSSIDLLAALEEGAKLDNGEGLEVIELVLMLGFVGIGFPIAALIYAKTKNKKVVKDAVQKLKSVYDSAENKWDGSAVTRKILLDKSTDRVNSAIESSSNFRNSVKNLGEDLLDKSMGRVDSILESSSNFGNRIISLKEGLYQKIKKDKQNSE